MEKWFETLTLGEQRINEIGVKFKLLDEESTEKTINANIEEVSDDEVLQSSILNQYGGLVREASYYVFGNEQD